MKVICKMMILFSVITAGFVFVVPFLAYSKSSDLNTLSNKYKSTIQFGNTKSVGCIIGLYCVIEKGWRSVPALAIKEKVMSSWRLLQ